MRNTNNSVKKHRSYLVLLFATLFMMSAEAKVTNYMGLYLHAGEWSLLPTGSEYSPSLGGAGGFGASYELQAGPQYSHTRFLFNAGVGAWGGMTYYMKSTDMIVMLENETNQQGISFDYVYDVHNRHDRYTNLAAQVPLMVGVQVRRFYALVGAKVTANLWTMSHSSALATTYGHFDKIIGMTSEGLEDVRDMPEYQFFTDMPISSSVKTSLRLGVDASVELGGRLGTITEHTGFDVPKRKTEYRLAGFIDFGLMDIHFQRRELALGTPNPSDPSQILSLQDHLHYDRGVTSPAYNTTSMIDNLVMTDIMSTDGFASKVQNVTVGVKFTVLFELPEKIGGLLYYWDNPSLLINSRGVKNKE